MGLFYNSIVLCVTLPLLNAKKAVANNNDFGQDMRTPVPPEEIIVQSLSTVHEVEEGGATHCSFPFLTKTRPRYKGMTMEQRQSFFNS